MSRGTEEQKNRGTEEQEDDRIKTQKICKIQFLKLFLLAEPKAIAR
jgi:hypothetical protein